MPEPVTEPDASVMAAEARRMIEMHGGDWDSLHAFATLHWDGGKFTVGTWCAIDTSYAPADYALIMRKAAFKRLQEEPENPPYAYALQIEAHVSSLPGTATREERAAVAADLKAEKLHLRADARECAEAWVADIHGRLWSARKFRDADRIEEHFTPASVQVPEPAVFTEPLVSVARMTGILGWGLEPTPEEQRALDAMKAFRKISRRQLMSFPIDAEAVVKVIETDTMTGWKQYLDNMSTSPWSGTFTREHAEASVKWREENITRRYAYAIVAVEPHMIDNAAAFQRHAERHGRRPVTDCGDLDCREAATRLLHEELDRRFAESDQKSGEA